MINVESAEVVALQAFEFIASSDEQLERFMTTSGFDPGSLGQLVQTRHGLAGLLDYLCGDESLLLAFCETANIGPQMPAQAQAVLQRHTSTGAL
jgi:hypothetical protein